MWGQVRHKWRSLAAFPDGSKAQLSQKRTERGRHYESQTLATPTHSCYGPRLVRTHLKSGTARVAAVFGGFLLVAAVYSRRQADAVHMFGYGRAQNIAALVAATLQVSSVAQLARVMGRIEQLKDVVSVQRDLG